MNPTMPGPILHARCNAPAPVLDDGASLPQLPSRSSDRRPRLIFSDLTAIGRVLVWRAQQPHCAIYDLRVEDPTTGRELERHRIFRTDATPSHSLTLSSVAGSFSFRFDAEAPHAAVET